MNDDENFNQNEPDIMAGRKWAMWVHLSSLLWVLLTVVIPIPFFNLIGPLIIWRSKKEKYKLVNEHGKESLNFQLSQLVYFLISVLIFALLFLMICGGNLSNDTMMNAGIILLLIIPLFYLLMGIFQIAVVIFAAIKAKKGEFYRYPFTIQFLK